MDNRALADLPSELLSEIFLIYLSFFKQEVWSGFRPFVIEASWIPAVAHVCVHWRMVALSTPQLWTDIVISPHFACRNMVHEFLSRSVAVDLHVYCSEFFDRGKSTPQALPDLSDSLRIPWFSWISNDIGRVASLWTTPSAMILCPDLQYTLCTLSAWPSLRNAAIQGSHAFAPECEKIVQALTNSFAHAAPKLTTLLIPRVPADPLDNDTLRNLRSLTIDSPFSGAFHISQILTPVKDSLYELNIRIFGNDLSPDVYPVIFTCLQYLSIKGTNSVVAAALPIFHFLQAPKTISIHTTSISSGGFGSIIRAASELWNRCQSRPECNDDSVLFGWESSNQDPSLGNPHSLHVSFLGSRIFSLTISIHPELEDSATDILNVFLTRPRMDLIVNLNIGSSLHPPCFRQWWSNFFQKHCDQRQSLSIFLSGIPFKLPFDVLFGLPHAGDSTFPCSSLGSLTLGQRKIKKSQDLESLITQVAQRVQKQPGLEAMWFDNFGKVDDHFLSQINSSVKYKFTNDSSVINSLERRSSELL